jgi:hypothetical protein
MEVSERPDCVTDEQMTFLDECAHVGTLYMFGARALMVSQFNVHQSVAHKIVNYWENGGAK